MLFPQLRKLASEWTSQICTGDFTFSNRTRNWPRARASRAKTSNSSRSQPTYTAVQFFDAVVISLMLGTICWRFGGKRETQQDLFNAVGSLYAAILFTGITNGTAVQPVVSIERFNSQERAAGMYSALPFAFAQVVIELPYIFSKMMIYCSIFYSMATSQWTFLNFVCYLFFMHFTVMYFMFYGMMTTAVTSNHNVASTIAAHYYMLWNLFSGFMIPYKRIPIWWRWYYWANPMARLLCLSGCSFIFRHDFLGVTAITVFGFCILLAIIFAVAVKSFNSWKR